jgi:hypothetical protein
MTPASCVETTPGTRRTCTLCSINVDHGRGRNRRSTLSEIVSSTTCVSNWVILVKTRGVGEFVGILPDGVYLKLLGGGGSEGEVSVWPILL